MLIIVEQERISRTYRLKCAAEQLIQRLSGYMDDMPLAADEKLKRLINDVDNILKEEP